jgi:glucans biosynthesis protein
LARNDWVAFLGASYFRAIGELHQYGLSARGVALRLGGLRQTRDSRFLTQFYFETPPPGQNTVPVRRCSRAQSIAGAFRFLMRRTRPSAMEVGAALYLRRRTSSASARAAHLDVLVSEKAKPTASTGARRSTIPDGLALWTWAGRAHLAPLQQPAAHHRLGLRGRDPRGLRPDAARPRLRPLSRRRALRAPPSLWIEPLGDWGRGSVQLIEIPTDDEIHDNIVAMWVPEQPGPRRDGARVPL